MKPTYDPVHYGRLGQALTKDDAAKDVFNFYQSWLRIHIEQAFGQLVRRFGLLWKPIQFSIHSVLSLVHACMCIHNLIIDERRYPLRKVRCLLRTM
jgi:hypothetical protein